MPLSLSFSHSPSFFSFFFHLFLLLLLLLLSSFSSFFLFFFSFNLGLILDGGFGRISPLLWVVILGKFQVDFSTVVAAASSSSLAFSSSTTTFAFWVWLVIWVWWFFLGEGLMNLRSRFRINLKNLMICINFLLDSRK